MLDIKQIESFYPEPLRPFRKNLLREYLQYKILEAIFEQDFLDCSHGFRPGRSCHQALHDLRQGMEKYPQVMINVPVLPDAPARLAESEPINEVLRQVEAELDGRGRVILRPSGTEPLVRVTLEGADSGLVERLARQLADTVQAELGA